MCLILFEIKEYEAQWTDLYLHLNFAYIKRTKLKLHAEICFKILH